MLEHLPLALVVAGLCAYAVLGGADFGAGFWILASAHDSELADHARHCMGPVWEANHVWLIYILVVSWTVYPRALASVTSTLAIVLLIGLLGIVLRGAAYAARAQTDGKVGRDIDRVLGFASVLAPFAFGAAAGAIALGHVPVGNARGDLLTSWLNPTGIVIGVLSVVTGWYLAAVHLAADARRQAQPELERAFRVRSLLVGVIAGALALVALWVVHGHARPVWHGLTTGWGIAPLSTSLAAGVATLVLAYAGWFGAARVAASAAVAAVVVGWAVGQRPYLLPALTVHEAAAGHSTLVAVLIVLGGGSVILVPSLTLLFRLALMGRFDPGRVTPPLGGLHLTTESPGRRRAGLVAGLLLAGVGLTVFSVSTWTLIPGIVSLLGFVLMAFPSFATPGECAGPEPRRARSAQIGMRPDERVGEG